MFSLNEVRRLAERRSQKGRNRAHSPSDPEWPQWRGRIRTKLEPPPNDLLISCKEAAGMLGVTVARVSAMVLDGTLFAWQAEPGKHGCPLYLSVNQVDRLSKNDEHLRRSKAWREGHERCSRPGQRPVGQRKEDVEFRFERRMSDVPKRALKQDHGEFYTTSQAAEILGVTRNTVRTMRRRGTLTGYRSPSSGDNKKIFNRRRYWFFKREDVHALQHDEQRLHKRKAYLTKRYPWIYGDEANQQPYTEPEYRPHEANAKPLPSGNPFEELREGMRNW